MDLDPEEDAIWTKYYDHRAYIDLWTEEFAIPGTMELYVSDRYVMKITDWFGQSIKPR